MKRLFLLLLFVSSLCFAQNSGITYQAAIYNPSGEELPGVDNSISLLTNTDICLKFSIVDGNGLVEYQENATVTTDNFGMVNLLIGTHEQTGGYAANFASITWGDNTKFLKVDLDIEGNCTNFEELSNQPFTYVPFAYYSPASDVPGPAGPAGADGADGADGAVGQDGATGAVGPSGALGADGAVGPRGPVGVTGSQGVQGPQGIQGPDGADGSAGPTGAQGPIGPQGANGLLDSGDNIGDILYWDGSQWPILPIGSEGDVLTVIDALPSWSPQATPSSGSLIGCDGEVVPSIVYGSQEWTVENACHITYRDGTPIPQVTDTDEWESLTTGAWCYYDNDPTKGKLYNWYAVNDSRGLAPEGWSVASDSEWTQMISCLGGGTEAAKKIMTTTRWEYNEGFATNESGFSALPEGSRSWGGSFNGYNILGSWWTSTSENNCCATSRSMVGAQVAGGGQITSSNSNDRTSGFSVRCLNNNN